MSDRTPNPSLVRISLSMRVRDAVEQAIAAELAPYLGQLDREVTRVLLLRLTDLRLGAGADAAFTAAVNDLIAAPTRAEDDAAWDRVTAAEQSDRRALEALAPYFDQRADAGVAAVSLLADLRALIGRPSVTSKDRFENVVDRSRTLWHRRRLENIDHRDDVRVDVHVGAGPRETVWRNKLELDGIVGGYWAYWPETLKGLIVAACVEAEATHIREHLQAVTERTGETIHWNPMTGRAEFPDSDHKRRLGGPDVAEARAGAYLAVLDQYQAIEADCHRTLVEEARTRLAQLGYELDHAPRTETHHPSGAWVYPRERKVLSTGLDEETYGTAFPVSVDDARGMDQFLHLVDELPPLQVEPDDPTWWRMEYERDVTRGVNGFNVLDRDVIEQIRADFANERARAVNDVIPPGWVWDPRINRPFRLEHTDSEPFSMGPTVLAAIETAKRSVDNITIVRRALGDAIGDYAWPVLPPKTDRTTPQSGPLSSNGEQSATAMAFPDTAQSTPVDTSEDPVPEETYPTAPTPEP